MSRERIHSRAEVTVHQVRHEFIFGGQLTFWAFDPAHAGQGDQTAVLQRPYSSNIHPLRNRQGQGRGGARRVGSLPL
ncbi:MAG: hypothetical protein BMS9Abin28_0504 [Anaerolineae bacterium]|nr:MAG: hypothetical protein BMS9Abin28_0504 [Anaerolineae bacterium]